MLNFCDFIQVYVFTTNHHLKKVEFTEPGKGHASLIFFNLFGRLNMLFKRLNTLFAKLIILFEQHN